MAVLFLALSVALGCHRSEPPQVIVYASLDQVYSEPILQDFAGRTGIRVRPVYDSEAAKTTGLVSRLIAERQRPRGDVFWNNELVQTLLLADQGVLESYHSPSAADIPNEFKDPDGRWTGIAARARVIVYNTKLVSSDQLPRRLADLSDSRWRDQVAIANPRAGSTRIHVAALFAALGPEPAKKMLASLMDNGARVVDGNAMVKNLVARGVVKLGLTDTDDVHSGKLEGEPVEAVYPDQDSLGTLIFPNTICLIRGAPHPDAARRLIDYLLSPEVEERLAAGPSAQMPVRADVKHPPDVPSCTSVRSMKLTPKQMLEQLAPSSRWVEERFR